MKKASLLFVIINTFLFHPIFSQCPGCIVDVTCTANPAAPKLCPDIMPPGTAMQYYDEDITFFMPAQFVDAGTGFNVTLNRIEVTGIIGMPFGLNFQSSSPTNNFYPSSNPPATERGCAKICGTPLLPGDYTITVYVKAYVTVLGLNQTQDDFFDLPITILPSASGNNSFTMSNSYGCAPVTTIFTPIHQSNGNPGFSYSWNLGNGVTSNSEFPTQQTYNNPGSYPVSLVTTIDTIGYLLSSVSVNNANCDDGLWGSPDPYIKIIEGSTTLYQSSYVDDTYSASFNFSAISLNNTTYKIEVWDYDTGLLGGDDFCGQVTFNGHTAGNHSYTVSGMNVSFNIQHPVIQFNDNDTIHVLPTPQILGVLVTPGDTVCTGDSILLQVQSNGSEWQWYMDSLALIGYTQATAWVHQTGNYNVVVMNNVGCTAVSDTLLLHFFNLPPTPTFWQNGSILQTLVTGYDLQWYFEGNPIPGANGQYLHITQSGMYMLEAKNDFGCASYSNGLYALYTNIYEHQEMISDLIIYPNPASDLLNIQFYSDISATIEIVIYDVTGRQISAFIEESNAGINDFSFDLSSFTKGMYIFSLKSGDTSIYRNIVKN